MKSILLNLILLLSLIACSRQGCESGEKNGQGVQVRCADIDYGRLGVSSRSGIQIGYVFSFNFSGALIYVSELDSYHTIDLNTGEEQSFPMRQSETLYFSGPDCDGTAYTFEWAGPLGQTHILTTLGRSLVIEEARLYFSASRIRVNSYLDYSDTICRTATVDISGYIATLSEVSPVDFTAGAPYEVFGE